MILLKIVQIEDGREVKDFEPQYFLCHTLNEAYYRLYCGYLENKMSPAFNLPGFKIVKLWADSDVSFDSAFVRDVVSDVIDKVKDGKPDSFQVNGKMY